MRGDLVVLVLILGLAFASMPVFAWRRAAHGGDPLESSQRGTFILGNFVRSWFYWFAGPAERMARNAGVGPLFFNLAGATLGALAGVAFALGRPVLGGWAVLLGGVADIFDGRIARATGVASPRGAFIDSTMDRFAEVGVFAGLAVFFHARPFVALAVVLGLGGSLLVSYTRARGESQGVTCKVGLMQRAERMLLLGFGGLLDPAVSDWTGWGAGTLLVGVLILIAVGTLWTAVYRTVWITRRLPSTPA